MVGSPWLETTENLRHGDVISSEAMIYLCGVPATAFHRNLPTFQIRQVVVGRNNKRFINLRATVHRTS